MWVEGNAGVVVLRVRRHDDHVGVSHDPPVASCPSVGESCEWRTEAPVLTAGADAVDVERRFGRGELTCEGYGGTLAPWGTGT
jgi:hypothetical protein